MKGEQTSNGTTPNLCSNKIKIPDSLISYDLLQTHPQSWESGLKRGKLSKLRLFTVPQGSFEENFQRAWLFKVCGKCLWQMFISKICDKNSRQKFATKVCGKSL